MTEAPTHTREVAEADALYFALCEQIQQHYDGKTIFYPADVGANCLVETKEYPFCFVFALMLRTLRELGDFQQIEVGIDRKQDTIEIKFRGSAGAPNLFLKRLEHMHGIFAPSAKDAGLVCLTARRWQRVIVQLNATIYEGADFVLSAIDTEEIGSAIAAAFSLDLTPYK